MCRILKMISSYIGTETADTAGLTSFNPSGGHCSPFEMSCVCPAPLARDNLGALVLDMLFHWARGQTNTGAASRLAAAMIQSGRRDLAEEIEDIVSIGRRKYSDSLRRVGLEEGGEARVDEPTPAADGRLPLE